MHLSELSTDGVIALIERIEDLKPTLPKLEPILRQNAINGRVLKHCDINDLKNVSITHQSSTDLISLLISLMYVVNNRSWNYPSVIGNYSGCLLQRSAILKKPKVKFDTIQNHRQLIFLIV